MTASYTSRAGEFWIGARNSDLTGVTAGSTVFWNAWGAGSRSGTESNVQNIVPKAATVTQFDTDVEANAIAESTTITLRVNSADTALVNSYSGGTGHKSSTGSVSVSAGDRLAIELTAGGSDADTITLGSWIIVFDTAV